MRTKKLILLSSLLIVLLFTLPTFAEDDRVRIGNDSYISADEYVRGDSVTIFGDQKIDGVVDGTVVTIFGDVEVSGQVDEELVTIFGKVILHDGARISGDLVSVMGTIERSENSSVYGEVTSVGPAMLGNVFQKPLVHIGRWKMHWWSPFRWNSIIFSILITLIVIYFFKRYLDNINKAVMADPLRNGVKGLLGNIVAVLVIILLGITILGIPVAVIFGLVLWVANTFGIIAIYLLVGERLAEQMKWEVTPYVHGIIGAAIFFVIALVPMGGLVKIVAGWVGLGGIIQTKFGTGQPWG